MDIDYSGIPHARKPSGALGNFKSALLIVLGIGVVLSLGAFFTRHSNHARDIVMPILSACMVFIFIGTVMYSFWIALTKSRQQSKQMQRFASQNNWTYEGKQPAADESLFPPGSRLISNQSWMSFKVTGKTPSGKFELYLLKGLVARPVAVQLVSNTQSFGFLTVFRTEFQLPEYNSDDYYTVNDNGYGYAVHIGNAVTKESLETFFNITKNPLSA